VSPGADSAASHPDSQAVRPGAIPATATVTGDGVSFSWASGAVGAAGAALAALLALLGASAMRERRRLVLR
jgi:hypothetical protein